MKRIFENNLEKELEKFKGKNIIIEIRGRINLKISLKKVNIVFDNVEFTILDGNNKLTLNFSYIEQIIVLEKTKIKFMIEQSLEIIINYI